MPKSNAKIYSEKETERQIDPDGKERVTVVEKTRKIENSTEPDYIKLYTKMWCEFNEIPEKHRPLFLELATRMTYANTTDPNGGQIIYTGEPVASSICKSLGWKQKDSLMKGLRALCDCQAIRKINRAVYQINPSYAGKGEWKYRPTLDRGGVEDLIATFNFRDKKVDTQVIWADDGTASDDNQAFREMLDVNPERDSQASMTYTQITPIQDGAGAPAPTDIKRKKKKEVAV